MLSSFIFLFFHNIFQVIKSDPQTQPLLTLTDITANYQGAFRISSSTYGTSNMNFAQGPFEYHPERNSIIIVGHSHQNALAEFPVPELSMSEEISELNMSVTPLQEFGECPLGRASGGNNEAIDSIGGLKLIDRNRKLLLNAYEYYDAPGDDTISLLIMNPGAMNSDVYPVKGYYGFANGGPGHHCMWISSIPTEWKEILEGDYIVGGSSGIPIISRCTVGPSAFSFWEESAINAEMGTEIPTTKLMDFSLSNGLVSSDELSNESGENDLWTHLSFARYGFIPPNTRTYVTLGHSGGHGPEGVCYKCTQDNGNLCGGYCTPDADDNYLYYWLWDVNDFIKVKNGEMESYEVRPYEYGEFPAKFPTTRLGGASFDQETGNLYIALAKADREQGTYSNPPIFVVYKFDEDPVLSNAPETAALIIGLTLGSVLTIILLVLIIGIIIFVIFFPKFFKKASKA